MVLSEEAETSRHKLPVRSSLMYSWLRLTTARLAQLFPSHARLIVFMVVALPLFALADQGCLWLARLPVEMRLSSTNVVVRVDGQYLVAAVTQRPDAVIFVSASRTMREFQIDGTDNANNFTEDAADLAGLLPSPAYQFEAWMRDNAVYSTWKDVVIRDEHTGTALTRVPAPSSDQTIVIPWRQNQVVDVSASLERPEGPTAVDFLSHGQVLAMFSLDRNARTIDLAGSGSEPFALYFPERPLPFAAEVADTVLRVAIWAWVLLAIAFLITLTIAGMARLIASRRLHWDLREVVARMHWSWRDPWFDRLGATALVAGFAALIAIALAQYHGEPHILDASAYYFQAKTFALGRLTAPIPTDLQAFQGPFMVAWQGRWFAQYPPATSAVLAVGMWLGAPWLVEPLLGVASLFGIYLLGRRMFGRATALLALLLGVLSPFFLYLAASSYLSHVVALCFEVYFLVFVLRFMERYRQRDIMLAGAFLGAMFCTRELSAVLCGVLTSMSLVVLRWRDLWSNRQRVVPALLVGISALGVGLALYLSYNFALTGSAVVLPRQVFSPADRYGFGDGIGFYGRHTLAAGLVVLDQLLTSLMIDLFGWPFYLTLAFVPVALMRRDGRQHWDRFNLLLAGSLTLAQIGYFYHGIFLGPRYLYETLPFLLLLTARGIVAVPEICSRGIAELVQWRSHLIQQSTALGSLRASVVTAQPYTRRAAVLAATIVVAALVGFNLTFYLPRQIAQHQNFTGLPSFERVDVAAIYAHRPHHALVLTSDSALYNYVLFPLNDPLLHGDTLYAYAPGPEDVARLRHEYPDRTTFKLAVDSTGHVTFVPQA